MLWLKFAVFQEKDALASNVVQLSANISALVAVEVGDLFIFVINQFTLLKTRIPTVGVSDCVAFNV
jgi:hypothetical protein